VIETGTLYGGSALYYVQALHGLGLTTSRVLTVDIADNTLAASRHPLWSWVQFFHGSSTDPRIVEEIARLTRGTRTVVTLDSDHSMKHVLAELRLYGFMVSPGSYIIVEDTHMDGSRTHGFSPDTPGPLAAVEQFLHEDAGKEFEQDLTREPFIMTWNPGGWLKRKTPAARPASAQ
jgi:cephalosporin hydroxylase